MYFKHFNPVTLKSYEHNHTTTTDWRRTHFIFSTKSSRARKQSHQVQARATISASLVSVSLLTAFKYSRKAECWHDFCRSASWTQAEHPQTRLVSEFYHGATGVELQIFCWRFQRQPAIQALRSYHCFQTRCGSGSWFLIWAPAPAQVKCPASALRLRSSGYNA